MRTLIAATALAVALAAACAADDTSTPTSGPATGTDVAPAASSDSIADWAASPHGDLVNGWVLRLGEHNGAIVETIGTAVGPVACQIAATDIETIYTGTGTEAFDESLAAAPADLLAELITVFDSHREAYNHCAAGDTSSLGLTNAAITEATAAMGRAIAIVDNAS